MGNIQSNYLRIFPKESVSLLSEEFQYYKIAQKLLEGSRGYSYCMPFYISTGPYGKYIDIVYGAKWSVGNLSEFFDIYKDFTKIIFYRTYNEGEDYDKISCLPNREILPDIKIYGNDCWYGFDTIRFKSSSIKLASSIIEIFKDYFEVKIKGQYLSANNYCNNSFNSHKLDNIDNCLYGLNRQLLCENSELFDYIKSQSSVIEYFYNNKLVTYSYHINEYIKYGSKKPLFIDDCPDKWVYFPFDNWHNCVDEVYIKYIEKDTL